MSRGSYRAIHTVLLDGPDYQALTPHAKLVFLTLKLNLGPTGIDVLYPAVVEAQTGLSADQVALAMDMLEHTGWIRRERNLVWIVEGLRYEPSRALSNQNHRTEIAAHLASLPRLAIIDAFRAHYELDAVPRIPSPPLPIPSANGNWNGMGDGIRHGIPKHGETEERKTEEVKRSTDKEKLPSDHREKRAMVPDTLDDGFAGFWQRYPRRVGGNPKRRALMAWRARRRDGVTLAEMLTGLERYRAYLEHEGKLGTEYVMQAATFLGPDRRYEEAWELPADADDAELEQRVEGLIAEQEKRDREEAVWLAKRKREMGLAEVAS